MLNAIKHKAKELGFIATGLCRPDAPLWFDRYCAWLDGHKNADMAWLNRNIGVRKDPTRLLEGCRTIVSLAYPFPHQKPSSPDGLTVSRYAQPAEEDYHARLRRLCRELAAVIKAVDGGSRSRICVDSAPILERSYACASGIGFIGKNNMLIVPGYGSYVYLAEILTTAYLEFAPTEVMPTQCASCRRCIDACPTCALERAFCLDASRCLSYLTIESKKRVNEQQAEKMGDCFFGCDRCQEACPFNQEDEKRVVVLPSSPEWLGMSEETFEVQFGRSALARAGLARLKENIRAIKG
jgi:epoxyqueuosine reductase